MTAFIKSKKIISFLTFFLFLTNTIAYTFPTVSMPNLLSPYSSVSNNTQLIEVPESLGEVKEYHLAPGSTSTIVHIQTAHGHYGAQKSIHGLLDYLNKNYNMDLLLVEGATEKLNPELLQFFEDKKLNGRVLDILLREGLITGVDSYLVETEDNVSAYGIEDVDMYRKDLLFFQKVLRSQDQTHNWLSPVWKTIHLLESRILSKDLHKMIKEHRAYRESRASLLRYISMLYQLSKDDLNLDLKDARNQRQFPSLFRVLQLRDIESQIDAKKALKEKKKIVSLLTQKQVSSELIQAFEQIETQKWPRFVLEKIHEAVKGDINFEDYSNFNLYVRNFIFQSEIETMGLFEEVSTISDRLMNVLAKTKGEKQFLGLMKDIEKIELLLKLEVSRDTYNQINQNRETFTPSAIEARVSALSEKVAFNKATPLQLSSINSKQMDDLFRDSLSFYDFAKQREQAFLEKSFSTLKNTKKNKAVLISGGFHSNALKEEFRNQGISYVEVAPAMKEVGDFRTNYINAMLGDTNLYEKSQIEKVEALLSLRDQQAMGANAGIVVEDTVAAVAIALNQKGLDLTLEGVQALTETPFFIENGLTLANPAGSNRIQAYFDGEVLTDTQGNPIRFPAEIAIGQSLGDSTEKVSAASLGLVDKVLEENYLEEQYNMELIKWSNDLDWQGQPDPDTEAKSLSWVFKRLEEQYNEAIELIAKAGINPETGREEKNEGKIKKSIIQAEVLRARVVKQFYDIGISLMKKEKGDQKSGRSSYVRALYAFNKVKQMRPLTKQAYTEAVFGLKYVPPENAMPVYDELDSTRELNEYIKEIESDLEKAIDNYIGATGLDQVVLENIIYDLRISDKQLFGGKSDNGRGFDSLWSMTLALRSFLFTKNPEVSYAQKARAAEFLASLFGTYYYNGQAASELDEGGGISVPVAVRDELHEAKEVSDFEQVELKAFTTFAFNGDWQKNDAWKTHNLRGHSLTSMGWLTETYRALGKQYYKKSVADALEIENRRFRPKLAEVMQKLKAAETLKEKIKIYLEEFPEAKQEFKDGNGLVLEMPIRMEFSAGGVGDFAFLSANYPYLYSILNASGVLTRENGTIGRNINIGVQVQDLKQMRYKIEDKEGRKVKKQSYLTVRSIDMGFEHHVSSTAEIVDKSRASLILDALMSTGVFPKELLKQAKKDGKGEEVIKQILEKVLGTDSKGLVIDLHVENIAANSGLAVSNLIAMSVALAIEKLMKPLDPIVFKDKEGEKPSVPDVEQVARFRVSQVGKKFDNDGKKGFTQVEIKDTNESKVVYTVVTKIVDGVLEFEIPVSELPKARGGNYDFVIKSLSPHQNSPMPFKVSRKGVVTPKTPNFTPKVLVEITMSERTYEYVDSPLQVQRATINSQNTALEMGSKSGTQDDVSAMHGGIHYNRSGAPLEDVIDGRKVSFPGSVVPVTTSVILPKEQKEKLIKGQRIIRVGLADAADTALEQFYLTHMLSTQVDAVNAWGQITIESMKAMLTGNVVNLGRLSLASVALREKMGPVSVNPIVIDALEEILEEYGGDEAGFSYSITGARSTGSVIIYFSDGMNDQEIQEIVEEVTQRLDEKIKRKGKLSPREDKPKPYISDIPDKGARLRTLTSEEMQARAKRDVAASVVAVSQKRKQAQIELRLYKDEDVERTKNLQKIVIEQTKTLNADGRAVLEKSLDEEVARWKVDNPEETITLKVIESLAAVILETEYVPFRSSQNPAVRASVRSLLGTNSGAINSLNVEQQRLFFLAVNKQPSLLVVELNEEELGELVGELEKEDPEAVNQFLEKHEKAILAFNGEIQEKAEAPAELDGDRFQNKAFWDRLAREIDEKEAELEAERKKAKAEKDEDKIYLLMLVLELLEAAPNPEALAFDHFLFQDSDTYKEFFGKRMGLTHDYMMEGGVVAFLPAGGMGSRFGGGNVIKQAVNWHYGDEPDASYLRITLRRWAKYIDRFPGRKGGIMHVLVSAFTESAIKMVLNELALESGLVESLTPDQEIRKVSEARGYYTRPKDLVLPVTAGSMRPVVLPTAEELLLDLLLQKSDTLEEREQIERQYGWWIRKGRETLIDAAKPDKYGEQAKNWLRPPFKQVGLNPYNAFAPSGTAQVLETVFVEPSPHYSQAQLKAMGYRLDLELLKFVPETERRDGMSLAKAALIVKDKGLSTIMVQNSSSRAPIGDLTLGDAIKHFQGSTSKKPRIAVVQYANVAGGQSQGGVLVRKKEKKPWMKKGAITSLEGSRLKFGERVILDQDHVPMATGTIYLNAKELYRILGYEDPKEFLGQIQDRPESDKTSEYGTYLREKVAHHMRDVWPNIVQLKNRKEETGDESLDWKVLQEEAVLAILLESLQEDERLGEESVIIQEATAHYAFEDDKTPEEKDAGLSRQKAFSAGIGMITSVPPEVEGENKEYLFYYWNKWAIIYEDHGLTTLASEAIETAKRLDPEYRPEAGRMTSMYSKRLGDVERKVEKRVGSGRLSRVKEVSPDLLELMEGELLDSIEFLKSAEFKEGVSKEKRENARARKTKLSEIAEGIEKVRTALALMEKAKDTTNKDSFDFILNELIAIFNLIAERDSFYLPKKKSRNYQTAVRLFPHKIIGMVDKDATMASPGERISREDAKDIIEQVRRGVDLNILTGSTAYEAWDHIFVPIIFEIKQMDELPSIAKKVILERIRILANDGGSIVTVDTASEEYQPNRLAKNELYDAETDTWQAMVTLEEEKSPGKIDYTNRAKVWTVSVQAFLRAFVSQTRVQEKMGWTETAFPIRVASQMKEFIDKLEIKPEDLDPDQAPKEPKEGASQKEWDDYAWRQQFYYQDNLFNIHVSIADILQLMLNNVVTSKRRPRQIKAQIEAVLATRDEVNRKLERGNKEAFTPEEELMVALSHIHFKDSHWNYASLSGDGMDGLKDRGDSRVVPMNSTLLSRGLWKEIKLDIEEKIDDQPLETKTGRAIPLNVRAGPGYVNMPIGGVNKKNFLYGSFHDDRTSGRIIVIMGDSITDQGEFPHRSRIRIPRKIYDEIRTQIKKIPAALAKKITIREIKDSSEELELVFKGELSEKEKDVLKDLSTDGDWDSRFDRLERLSQDVYNNRLLLRVLLGDLSEMDSVERSLRMEDGLIRTQYVPVPDPSGSGFEMLKQGPASFYHIMHSMVEAADTNRILDKKDKMRPVRDRYLRLIVKELNQRKPDGVRMLLPLSMKQVKGATAHVAKTEGPVTFPGITRKDSAAGASLGREENARLLLLDLKKVEALTAENAATNYGVKLLIGRPLTAGKAAKKIGAWDFAVSEITDGKLRLNVGASHMTVSSLVNLQAEVVTREQLEAIDLDSILKTISTAEPFKIQFKEIRLDDSRQGNIVLVGQVLGGAKQFLAIKKAVADAGADVKWQAPGEGPLLVYITLGHLNSEILDQLTPREVRALKAWIRLPLNVEDKIVVEIDTLKLVHYSNRTAEEIVSEDVVLKIGEPTEPADSIKTKILSEKAFGQSLGQSGLLVPLTVAEYSDVTGRAGAASILGISRAHVDSVFLPGATQAARDWYLEQLLPLDVVSISPTAQQAIDSLGPGVAEFFNKGEEINPTESRRILKDVRSLPSDLAELDAMVLFVAKHKKSLDYQLLIEGISVEQLKVFKTALAQHVKATLKMELPTEFKMGIAGKDLKQYVKGDTKTPTALVTEDPLRADISYQRNLLRVRGSDNADQHNSTVIVVADRLLKELTMDLLLQPKWGSDLAEPTVWSAMVDAMKAYRLSAASA